MSLRVEMSRGFECHSFSDLFAAQYLAWSTFWTKCATALLDCILFSALEVGPPLVLCVLSTTITSLLAKSLLPSGDAGCKQQLRSQAQEAAGRQSGFGCPLGPAARSMEGRSERNQALSQMRASCSHTSLGQNSLQGLCRDHVGPL